MAIGLAVVLALQSLSAVPDGAGVSLDDALLDAAAEATDLRLGSTWLAQAGGAARDDRGEGGSAGRTGGSSSTSPSSGPAWDGAGSASTPQGRKLGIGIQLGYPTALSLKYMLRGDQGIQGGIGGLSGFAYEVGAFSLHADYVFHPHVLARAEAFSLTWYFGGGANVLVFGNPRQRAILPIAKYYFYPTTMWIGARVPIGVSLAFQQQPLEVFFEAVPSFLVFPGISFGLNASLGLRFYL